MQIPRSYVENYSKALNVVSDRARATLVDALSQIDYSADVATIREAVIAIMQPACGASSTMAARLAADFYDGLRARFGINDGYRAEVDAQREPEATEGAVRAFAHELDDSIPNVSAFQQLCVDRIDYETRLAANKCVEFNAKRDPKKPRWARIPTGVETCEFCIMLASRGFVYHSEETASHAHAHCDCRITPSWDKSPEAQGYNPDEYFEQYVNSHFHSDYWYGKNNEKLGKNNARTSKNLGRGGKFSESGINGMNEYLRSSKSLDELYERADEVLEEINERWNGDSSMFASASKTAKQMRSKLS